MRSYYYDVRRVVAWPLSDQESDDRPELLTVGVILW
jgi:hypothetical protein